MFGPQVPGVEETQFQDLLIWQLVMEVNELIRRGLQRRYERVEEELASPRGRIQFGVLAKRGGSREAHLPCIHHIRLEDQLLNQVLLGGLRLSIRLTDDLSLRSRVRLLTRQLEQEISTIRLSPDRLASARRKIDRLTQQYRPALTIIELLMESQGVSLTGEEQYLRLPGFLFDMNRFFQALIARFLQDNLEGFEVHEEYRLRRMLAYHPEHNPRRRKSPAPRPDFAILKRGRIQALLDTKYRDLWESDLPREMLYQLALYAFSQGSATILYPALDAKATEAHIQIQHPSSGGHLASIVLRPVNLLFLDQLISSRVDAELVRQRQGYARELVFGQDGK
jgi:5-methylcytosine-specific restriction enzyme subunit McrC